MNKTSDLNYSTDTSVFFYTPRYYPFDNFSAFSISIWGKEFPTVEHAYQWKKYSETEIDIAEKIFQAKNPHLVKKISDSHKDLCPPDWVDIKLSLMEKLLRTKVDQHEKIRELLLETGTKDIFENSPIDSYWGIGAEGEGKNKLGKLWMKLRDELQ